MRNEMPSRHALPTACPLARRPTFRQHAADRCNEPPMSHPRRIAVLLPLLLALLTTAALAQGVLRLGLNEDPDALDPARSGTFVGRIVFAATCDKLIDTDAHGQFRPAACDRLVVVAGQPGAHADASRRREFPGRRAAGRRRGARQPGALPHRAGEPAQGGAEAGLRGRGGRPAHRPPAPVAALCAAGRGAGRPRRDDDVAQASARPET